MNDKVDQLLRDAIAPANEASWVAWQERKQKQEPCRCGVIDCTAGAQTVFVLQGPSS